MNGLRLALVGAIGVMLVGDALCLSLRNHESALLFRGTASWYGPEEQGKLTANGEHYDRHRFTAASRHLPFNSIVRVTNQDNGRSVQVRINDRGPFVRDRILDLSEAAADTLGMRETGTAQVKVELVSPPARDASVP